MFTAIAACGRGNALSRCLPIAQRVAQRVTVEQRTGVVRDREFVQEIIIIHRKQRSDKVDGLTSRRERAQYVVARLVDDPITTAHGSPPRSTATYYRLGRRICQRERLDRTLWRWHW